MPKLTANTKYRSFIRERDIALEKFLHDAQKELSDIGYAAFKHILFMVSHRYRFVNGFTPHSRIVLDGLYAEIDHAFRIAAHKMTAVVLKLRENTTYLTYAGEVEAIARVLGHKQAKNISVTHDAASVEARLYYLLTKIRDRMTEAIERGFVNGEDPYPKVLACIPKVKRYKVPPRELKPLKEASAELRDSASLNFMDDEKWAQILQAYKDEYIPENRNLAFDIEMGEPDLEEWYGWEIEQEMNEDFLAQVRDGTNAAAQDAGVTDLMWVAVLDDKTRDEHRMKDGLTSSEIESKLEGEWSDFEDDATVAPSGFNCRCRSVPYVADLPEVEPVSYEGFNAWLNS